MKMTHTEQESQGPKLMGGQERVLPFEGAVNFRDLGGYVGHDGRRVKWRTIFRSDSLAELTDTDHDLWGTLGIRLVCDFRLHDERRRAPDRLPEGDDCRRLELPFIPRGTLDMMTALRRGTLEGADITEAVKRHYWHMPVDHVAEFRAVFAHILERRHRPAVLHCTSGKDRTGFAAAAILLALDVPVETVLDDYLLTNSYRRDVTRVLDLGVTEEVMDILTSAREDYLETALASIRHHFGSIERYLRDGLGLDAPRRARLRQALLD
jgi:protein-tyrosine phosphatase